MHTPSTTATRSRMQRAIAVATLAGSLALVATGCRIDADELGESSAPLVPTSTSFSLAAPASEGPASQTPESQTPPCDPALPSCTDAGALGEIAAQGLTALESLQVKGRAPMTGYERDEFGQSWADDVSVTYGRNGCDTRNDILRRDLKDLVAKNGTRGCVIASGTLDDPYTGTRIDFVRGQKTSTAVQIDHVVALADAWQKGAQQWDEAKRADFANDPRNLLAVDGPTNGAKGAGDAATWLPPNNSYRCTYVSKQAQVKAIYGLWVTQAEKDAIARVLASCAA